MKRVILVVLVVLVCLTGAMACGPTQEEIDKRYNEYYLDMAEYYDAKAQFEEQEAQRYFDSAQRYRGFAKNTILSQRRYNELKYQSQLHYEKAAEYRYMANQYRLKAGR